MNTSDEIAKELYEEVFAQNSKICLIYSSVHIQLENQAVNKKTENKIEAIFSTAFQLAVNGNVVDAKSLTLPYEQYKAFYWCESKESFIDIVTEIYSVIISQNKKEAYYPLNEGQVVGLQIHLDP